MKVLIVTQQSFLSSQTGIGTQVRETAAALRRKGCAVTVIQKAASDFLGENGEPLSDEEILKLSETNDVTHLINTHRPLVSSWRKFKRSPLVGSSVYWSGFERLVVTHRSEPFSWSRVHGELACLRGMCAWGNDMRGIDAFLPNSCAEGECIKRSYRMSKGAYYSPVPNGFNPPAFDVADLPRPECVPDEDYIVVPAVFAKRKNQRGLIKALRDSPYRVVFMGGEINKAYWDLCRSEATENMSFIGYKENGSRDYWAVLAHARCACLPSDCETPGIAMIEAAFAGARPAITKFGGTAEYYAFDAEYFHPCNNGEIRAAIDRAWARGRLTPERAGYYGRFTWDYCAEITLQAYRAVLANCRCDMARGVSHE